MIMCIMYNLTSFFPYGIPKWEKNIRKHQDFEGGNQSLEEGEEIKPKSITIEATYHLSIHASMQPVIHPFISFICGSHTLSLERRAHLSLQAWWKKGKSHRVLHQNGGGSRMVKGSKAEAIIDVGDFLNRKKNTVQFRNKTHTDFAS